MSKLGQRSDIAYKLNNGQPVDLAVTMSAGGSATAKLYQHKIIVDLDTAAASNTVTLTTPIAFEVIDVYVINESSTGTKVTLKNGANAITDLIDLPSNNTLYFATTIDNSKSIFARGDDDLVIATDVTGATTAKVIIVIEPVVN